MKKLMPTLLILAALALITAAFLSTARTVWAQETYSVSFINHEIGLTGNGYVTINDTVQIEGQASSFILGFPDIYGQRVVRSLAYSGSQFFPVTLDVPLGDRIGFYAVRVDFSGASPQSFSVEFVLSNSLLVQTALDVYTLNFPGYPSLDRAATSCNVTITLPEGTAYVTGTAGNLSYTRDNLPDFTHSADFVSFSGAGANLHIFDIKELSREIRLTEVGEISGSDSYYLMNKMNALMNSTEVTLPLNASNVSAEDQFGRRMSDPVLEDTNISRYSVSFSLSLNISESTRFTVSYALPPEHIQKTGPANMVFDASFFEHLNYYVEEASVTLVLPEGAEMTDFDDTLADDSRSVSRTVFQDSVSISKQGFVSLDAFSVEMSYQYNPLWLSFRPTIWVWTLAIIGCVVAAVWFRPKPAVRAVAPTLTAKLRLEDLKSFVDSYNEKMRIDAELGSLETKVQKGKIPRRRYKVLRRTLEARAETVSRALEGPSQKMRAAGGKYTDLMRQLEIAEAEMGVVETNIKNIEVQHNRGEISLEVYRKLLSDYERKRDGIKTTVNGILLRLREEIR